MSRAESRAGVEIPRLRLGMTQAGPRAVAGRPDCSACRIRLYQPCHSRRPSCRFNSRSFLLST